MRHAMDVEQTVDFLTYASYRHNRFVSPEVTVERWRRVYGPDAERFEIMYQDEVARVANEVLGRTCFAVAWDA